VLFDASSGIVRSTLILPEYERDGPNSRHR
jgi:hypothetical protein